MDSERKHGHFINTFVDSVVSNYIRLLGIEDFTQVKGNHANAFVERKVMIHDVDLNQVGRKAPFSAIENRLHWDFDGFVEALHSAFAINCVEAFGHHDVLPVNKLEREIADLLGGHLNCLQLHACYEEEVAPIAGLWVNAWYVHSSEINYRI
jgi:hypothetical protein